MAEVETSRDGAVLTITLNRPDVLNAFNAAMHAALRAALEEAERRVGARGRPHRRGPWLLRRPGPDRVPRGRRATSASRLRSNYHPNVLAIRALEKPVIAAVNGPAAGAGLSFACACDIRIAVRRARASSRRSSTSASIPDSGGTYFISRLLGLRARVRVDDVGPQAVGGRGARLGPRLGGRRGRRPGRRAPRSSPRSTRRCRRAASG